MKIADFGVATQLEDENGKRNDNIDNQMAGTICYMAPEVINTNICDYKQDVWSIGVILYQLLSGEIPFKGKDSEQICCAIVEDELAFNSQVWSTLSEECIDFVAGMLMKDSKKRMSMQEVLAHPWVTATDDRV